jgi:hypothetical protein
MKDMATARLVEHAQNRLNEGALTLMVRWAMRPVSRPPFAQAQAAHGLANGL